MVIHVLEECFLVLGETDLHQAVLVWSWREGDMAILGETAFDEDVAEAFLRLGTNPPAILRIEPVLILLLTSSRNEHIFFSRGLRGKFTVDPFKGTTY